MGLIKNLENLRKIKIVLIYSTMELSDKNKKKQKKKNITITTKLVGRKKMR